MKEVTILGGGLSGLSLAFFLQDRGDVSRITILEKESKIGGLCQSIHVKNYTFDVGPHIIFSKDKEILDLINSIIGEKNSLKRSNYILFQDRWIQYPFENDLSKLPTKELNYCLSSFLHNPYQQYKPQNMLQFFLTNFGEGITNVYLRPYNEKIWKFDPVYMNTEMVDRIPKPTDDAIQKSAAGSTVEGYLHQLYFTYPKKGGIESVVQGFASRLNSKVLICTNSTVEKISETDGCYSVTTQNGEVFKSDKLISTIPIQELSHSINDIPLEIQDKVNQLKYNSIIIAFVTTKKDLVGDHFAFMVPDKEIIFHRISKMDFLGESYQTDGASFMVEITYREHDIIDAMDDVEISKRIKEGICSIHFSDSIQEISIEKIIRRKFAYVIYDVNHNVNMEVIRSYYANRGIFLTGRFGNFEYWNMDRVIRESLTLSEKI